MFMPLIMPMQQNSFSFLKQCVILALNGHIEFIELIISTKNWRKKFLGKIMIYVK